MNDEGESLQAGHRGQAPRKPRGTRACVCYRRARKAGPLGTVESHKGVVEQAVWGSRGESAYCPVSESKISGADSSCGSLANRFFFGGGEASILIFPKRLNYT